MATGTNSTEIDELKELVRQLTNRVDILSASNTDLNTKLVKAKELFDAQAADLNARLVKSQEQVRDMERAIFASRKESDKITLPVWPTTQGFARWRESVLAITVAASGDKAAAAKFVSEVDNPNIELAAFVTNRPDEMISIDSKLYAAILSVLPKGDDGDRIHAAIKGSCASYCGRQAIRILDKDFQYQGPRKQKKQISTMVTLHLEGGLKGLGSFWTSWIEVRQDLKGTKDEPSLRTLGSLLEDKLKALGEADVPIGIALDNWRTASSAAESDLELEKAYKGLADAVESRCTDERNGRNAKTAAPAIENANDQAEDKSHNDQDISHKPKGRGRGNKGKREDATSVPGDKYEGYCNFNKVLCGNWGHHAKDCFYNPQSDKYKGDEFVKQHAAKKQEALQKITGAAATAVDHAEATQVEEATMNLDSMYRTWLQAKSES